MPSILRKKPTPQWRLPPLQVQDYFNQHLAKRLLGRHVLVGLTFLDTDHKLDHQEQYHGTVLSTDPKDGVEIWNSGTTDILTLPPDLRAWQKAKKGVYTLRSSGERIADVDYLSSWLFLPHDKQPIPSGQQFELPKSGVSSVYGFGTMYFGNRRCGDGSVVSTKWLTAFFFPFWPLGSYRIWKQSQKVSFGFGLTSSHYAQPVFLDIRQVIFTYIVAIPILILFIIACVGH